MNFDEWIDIGIANRWCGPAVCYTHDGIPLSELELDEMEETDICLHIVRLYNDHNHANDIELNHAPSNWRKP